MIQRIQTIYLLLAAAAMGDYFLPLATASGDATALAASGDNFFADGVYSAKEFPAGWGLHSLWLPLFLLFLCTKIACDKCN